MESAKTTVRGMQLGYYRKFMRKKNQDFGGSRSLRWFGRAMMATSILPIIVGAFLVGLGNEIGDSRISGSGAIVFVGCIAIFLGGALFDRLGQ